MLDSPTQAGTKKNSELEHKCGLRGFGNGAHDVCPACEFKRLVELGVPEEIAREAAEIRYVMNPDYIPPYGILALVEEFKALEEKYGQAIP